MMLLNSLTKKDSLRINPSVFFLLNDDCEQMSALSYIINNTSDANFIKWSYDEICSAYGASKADVGIGIEKLKEFDIIRDAGPNLWMFNPEIEWTGQKNRNRKAIEIYNSLEEYKPKH